jgi:exodeoxyribonuclease VII large subunit
LQRAIVEKRQRLTGFGKLLDSLSHKSVLQRGFALVSDQSDKLVRASAGLKSGDALKLEFSDGEASVVVGPVGAKPGKTKPAKRDPEDSQSSLF